MNFAKQFNEAAQNAVLSTIESGDWVKFPWMESMIKQAVREGLKGDVTISGDYTPNPLNALVEQKPVDICGCPFGECTCTTSYITKAPPCEAFSSQEKLAEAAEKFGIHPDVLGQLAKSESAENKTPIGGKVQTFDEPWDSFESNDFSHVEGYDWQIVCIDRMKNHSNSWAEHFNHPPTQEEFDYHFRHYEARTHYVHANRWENGKWVSFTSDYVPHFSKEKPQESFTTTSEWPEGKKYRIKFHDQRVGRENYVYFDGKPGGIVLAKYHSAKCFAVVEARPAGV